MHGGREVLAATLGVVDVFSDKSNHTAIQSELALAAEFYKKARSVPSNCKFPGADWFWADERVGTDKVGSGEWEASIGEFPFIFACLQLSLTLRDASLGQRSVRLADGMWDLAVLYCRCWGIVGILQHHLVFLCRHLRSASQLPVL
jgi:hypothetical protein